MTPKETIAALATAPGRGGVGIVRVSGPASADIATRLLGHCPSPRYAEYLPFHGHDGTIVDQGIALFFPGPRSFTGEDVLELQGHGGPVVMDLLLREVLAAGARPARPGEFSERAFLNGKIDLAQAEAIADLIESASEEAAQAALRSLQGSFSAEIQALLEQLIQLRMYVESAIDFSEDEVDFLSEGGVSERLQVLAGQVDRIRSTARQGVLLREGMTIVIAGRPNAGKSSLLNALSGRPAAIVTDIPGTTRDVLREAIAIDGLPLHIIDTAGLRESDDPVEREGIRRAWDEISRADRLLLVVDGTKGFGAEEEKILSKLPPVLPVTVISNKVDLLGSAPALISMAGHPAITVSAQTGEGLDLLRSHLQELMGYRGGGGGLFSARRRHLEALESASGHLAQASEQLSLFNAGELVAEELRLAQHELSSITGAFTADDLLGRIFADFCIGK